MNDTISTQSSQRVLSIDLLRGLVMVIMALDHVRDYFYYLPNIDPSNLEETTVALFFTRWITHFCAPVFVFMAGVSAYLSGRKRSKRELSWLLFTRGLWLIFLEFTVVLFGWTFGITYTFITMQVIWVIGISMIALAVFIYLPVKVLAILSVITIFGHNLLDGIPADLFGSYSWIWYILHEREGFSIGNHIVIVIYPLIPWVAVLSAGYCFGRMYELPIKKRIIYLWCFGIGATVLFFLIRRMNVYGEPTPWAFQNDTVFTLMSFLNCSKYPPSLLYILMTLGPAFIFLACTERNIFPIFKPIIVFGKAPMLYYILHIYVLHSLALVLAYIQTGSCLWMMDFFFVALEAREDYGLSLAGTYGVWILVVLTLYPVCRWYAKLKSMNHASWMRFL